MEKENLEKKDTNTPNVMPARSKTFSGLPDAPGRGGSGSDSGFQKRRGGRKFGGRQSQRAKPEFDQKIIDIRRVARVVAGGRRFSFSVALVAGNRKGSVGVGLGKATDTPMAIDKAFRDAQKNMVQVNLTKDSSIPYEMRGKVSSSVVIMMPAPGKGILAGSSVRDVLELAGIKNINAKLISRSKNKLNNAKAAIKALQTISNFKHQISDLKPKSESKG